jgi:hypothetical protein
MHRQDKLPSSSNHLAWALLLVAGCLCAGVFAYTTCLILGEPYLLNYTEGILLFGVSQVSKGAPLYQDINLPPHIYFAYGPLYPYLGAAVTEVFGFGILTLRTLTVVCELGISLLAYRILRSCEMSRLNATSGALLVLGILGFHKFHAIARVDMLVLTAVFFGYGELFSYLRDGKRRRLIGLAIAMAIAMLGKASAVISLGAVGLVAVIELFRQPRRGIALVVACAGAGLLYGVVAWWFNARTGGAFFRFQFAYQGASGFCNPFVEDCKWQLMLFQIPLYCFGSLFVVSLLAVLVTRGGGYLGLLALVAAAWVGWASFKDGADQNYNIELFVLLGLLIARALPRWLELAGRAGPRVAWYAQHVMAPVIILACLTSPLLTGLPIHDWDTKAIGHPTREDTVDAILFMSGDPKDVDLDAPFDMLSERHRAERQAIAELTRQATGILLAEEPFFAVLEGKEVWMTDPFQLGILHQRGMFDVSPILEACRDGRIQWVFAGFRLLAIEGLPEVLETHFTQVYRTKADMGSSHWTVYRHR